MQMDVNGIKQHVLPHYLTAAELEYANLTVAPLGNGHINSTWLVSSNQRRMVLQQLNTQVFTSPWSVVENAMVIANFLQQQTDNYALLLTYPVLTLAGQLAVEDAQHGFWRAISFVENSHSIEKMHTTEQAQQTAYAFGTFAAALGQMDTQQLQQTIPDFRHLAARLQRLQQVAQDDPQQRRQHCLQWLAFAESQRALLDEVAEMEAKLPLRICHNDTKINNLLFDADNQPMAVVDLDTCMPGYLMYDFGDMVRSCCASVAEDATQLAEIDVLPDYFAAISQGWLQALAPVMTPLERDSLWLGVKVVTLMLAVRFLTDYLDGDRYFRIHHAEHNLERAINQFTLYQRFVEHQDQLQPLLQADPIFAE
ncbi:phosphotransferase enzyme family protein [Shewanella sp.]|uniref:phosphotransferase enzyme family protein n=1 Tax=Shewanella sp. TaxID=50422 RepID=UPI003A978DF1